MNTTKILVLFIGLASCASSHELPYIDESPGVAINLLERDEELPSGCHPLGRIYAEDGWVGSRRWAYEGTEERALHRLRNEAARLHANYIVLDRNAFSEGIALDAARGHSIRVEGHAYQCSPNSRRMLPNKALELTGLRSLQRW